MNSKKTKTLMVTHSEPHAQAIQDHLRLNGIECHFEGPPPTNSFTMKGGHNKDSIQLEVCDTDYYRARYVLTGVHLNK